MFDRFVAPANAGRGAAARGGRSAARGPGRGRGGDAAADTVPVASSVAPAQADVVADAPVRSTQRYSAQRAATAALPVSPPPETGRGAVYTPAEATQPAVSAFGATIMTFEPSSTAPSRPVEPSTAVAPRPAAARPPQSVRPPFALLANARATAAATAPVRAAMRSPGPSLQLAPVTIASFEPDSHQRQQPPPQQHYQQQPRQQQRPQQPQLQDQTRPMTVATFEPTAHAPPSAAHAPAAHRSPSDRQPQYEQAPQPPYSQSPQHLHALLSASQPGALHGQDPAAPTYTVASSSAQPHGYNPAHAMAAATGVYPSSMSPTFQPQQGGAGYQARMPPVPTPLHAAAPGLPLVAGGYPAGPGAPMPYASPPARMGPPTLRSQQPWEGAPVQVCAIRVWRYCTLMCVCVRERQREGVRQCELCMLCVSSATHG